ncbi:MAG TPA: heavy-metal-associated domain-containing protein [Acidimicrobiales bacterium]|nr:heavy-metal-associated domain-containing protein [Acidimicrobiales bacterium]
MTVTSSTPATPEPTGASAPATAVLAVEGMHCGACVALIEETLVEQDGVTRASVDLESARAVVEYDPARLGTDRLAAAIAEAGYTASPAG